MTTRKRIRHMRVGVSPIRLISTGLCSLLVLHSVTSFIASTPYGIRRYDTTNLLSFPNNFLDSSIEEALKASSTGTLFSRNKTTTKSINDHLDRLQKNDTAEQPEYDEALALCVANDAWEKVLSILELMKTAGLQQERSTYKACFRNCFETSNAESARLLLDAMEKAGFEPEIEDTSLVVLTFCRQYHTNSTWLPSALELVKSYPNVSSPAYDAVLCCLVEERQWKTSLRILRSLEENGCPTVSTYRLVIECCVASNQAEQAMQILQTCVKRGLVPTLFSFELVVASLSRRRQWRRARQLIDMMTDQLHLRPSLQIYNSVLQACSKDGEVVASKQILVGMRKYVVPDIRSFNAVMSACAKTGRWKDAQAILDQCHREPQVQPDIYTYTNAIRACAKAGKTRRAITLFQVVKDKRLPLDAYVYTATIDACAKAGMSRKAMELVDEMEKGGIHPTEVTYSVAITACGNNGKWKQALDLLRTMQSKKLNINIITYNAAITALSKAAKVHSRHRDSENEDVPTKGGLYKTVLEILDEMRNQGIKPDGFSYSAAISCCGAEGQWKEALELIGTMQKSGGNMKPNKIAYTAAIASCGRSGKIEESLRLFRQMKDQGLAADRVAYNALFSALRVAKRPAEAYQLWLEMTGVPTVGATTEARVRRNKSITPDIISVTDAIAALSSGKDTRQNRERIDEVFEYAVEKGILLRGNFLDSKWEIDLSGLTLPVSRAAVRHILKQIDAESHDVDSFQAANLTLITGVGSRRTSTAHGRDLSLRDYVQQTLREDMELTSSIPERAEGTVQIDEGELRKWLKSHRTAE